jgi:tetratricopeptide (TPR) repeat protein
MSLWIANLALALLGLQGAPVEAPVPNQLVLSLPAAKPGAWKDFFVDHQPTKEALAAVPHDALQGAAGAQAAYDRGDFPGAFRAAEFSLAAAPDFPPSLLLLGTAAFRLRRHGDVKSALARFLDVAPGELWRTQVLGHSLYSLGEYAAAREHYRRVLDVFPASTEARRGFALTLFRMGEDAAAEAELVSLVEAAPDSAPAWAWLAQVRFDMDELDGALAAARKAIELDPFDPRPVYLASRALFDLGMETEAEVLESRWADLNARRSRIDSLKNQLLFAPTDMGLHFVLCGEYAELGDAAHLETAVARLLSQPADAAQLLERGLRCFELLRRGGAPARAKTLADKLAELYPTDPRAQALGQLLQD